MILFSIHPKPHCLIHKKSTQITSHGINQPHWTRLYNKHSDNGLIMEMAVTLLLQDKVYDVEAFEGIESINAPFHFIVTMIVPPLGMNALLGQEALLSIPSIVADQPRQFLGLINAIKTQQLIRFTRITLTIIHPLYALCAHKEEQQFYRQTPLEVACKLLKKHHIPFELLGIKTETISQTPLLHQVKEETTLTFFHRLLSKINLMYFVKDNNQLCLFDRLSFLNNLENDTLHYLPTQKQCVSGMLHFYGFHQETYHQKTATNAHVKNVCVIESGLSHLKSAKHLTLILPAPAPKGSWHVITKVEHFYCKEKTAYHNKATLESIKKALPFKVDNSPYSKTAKASIHSGEQCANLNAYGHYQYRLSSGCDLNKNKHELQAQPYIPRLSSYAGSPLKGIHFPLQKDDDILIAYLKGAVESPFIIANINRAYQHPQLSRKTLYQSHFVLPNEMSFRLDDAPKKNAIELTLKFNQLLLNAEEALPFVTLNSAGYLTLSAQENIYFNAKNHTLNTQYDAIYDVKESYHIEVKNNYYEKTHKTTHIRAKTYIGKTQNHYQIKAKNIVWNIEKKVLLTAIKGDIQLQSPELIHLKSKLFVCQSYQNMALGLSDTFFKCHKGTLEFKTPKLQHNVTLPIAYFGKINHLSAPRTLIKAPPHLTPKITKHEVKNIPLIQSLFNVSWSSNGVSIKNKAFACFQIKGYKKGDRGRVIIYQCTTNQGHQINADPALEKPAHETLKEIAQIKFKVGDPSLYPFAFEYNKDPGSAVLEVPWPYQPLPKSTENLTYYRFEIELLSERFDNYSQGMQWLKDIEITHKKNANVHAIKVIRTQLSTLTICEHDLKTNKTMTCTLTSESLQPLVDNKAVIKNVPVNAEHQLFLLSQSEKRQEVISHDNQSVSPSYRLIPNQDNKSEQREIQSLHPPIIMNLNDVIFDEKSNEPLIENPSDEHARLHLTKDELTYFKNNGDNVTIFIHGFNVPYGEFGEYIESLEYVNLKVEDLTKGLNFPQKYYQLRVKKSNTKKTIKLNFDAHIKNLDKTLSSKELKFSHDYEPLRDSIEGVGMHSWLTDFEDNLNNAAGFNKDYSEFTRGIFIAWPGEPNSPADYMAANAQSKKTGRAFAELLLQLRTFSPNMEINVIAHSQGNGVMLSAFDYLGEYHPSKKVNHAFAWQAALPFTALNGESESTGINPHYLSIDIKQKVERERKQDPWYLPYAYKGSEHFTVLYSQNDNIVGKVIEQEDQPAGVNEKAVFERKPLAEYLAGVFTTYLGLGSLYEAANQLSIPASHLLEESNLNALWSAWVNLHPDRQIKLMDDKGKFIKYANLSNDLNEQINLLSQEKVLHDFCHTISNRIKNNKINLNKKLSWLKGNDYLKGKSAQSLLKNLGTLEDQFITNHLPKEVSELSINKLLLNAHHSNSGIVIISDLLKKYIFDSKIKQHLPWLVKMITFVYCTEIATTKKPINGMGWYGADMNNPVIKNLRTNETFDNIDCTRWVFQHSDMKMPSKDIMEEIYKKRILKKINFGNYSESGTDK